jgi:signal transduction histidine kinase
MLEANEMLMAVLSHDLRTPLSAVLTSAEYLMHASSDGSITTVANRIKNSSMRMARMVDQLLNLARLQGGRLQLQPSTVELATLCQTVIDEFTTRNGGGRIAFVQRGNPIGTWDADLIWQALSNLVSNALNHGKKEQGVSVEVDGEDPDRVFLRVANEGAIPTDVLPTLFKPFKATSTTGRPREGLGLGLHIVQEIVHMHGGEVSVQSSETPGTTFTIELPRAGAGRRS